MLQSASGKPVVCSKLHTTCKSAFLYLSFVLIHFLTGRGLRYCKFRPNIATTHSFTSHQAISVEATASHTTSHVPTDNAHIEVFNKTLGFFCALVEKECAFSCVADFPDSGDTIEQENNCPVDPEDVDADSESRNNTHKCKVRKCHGRLELRYDTYNQPYIQ